MPHVNSKCTSWKRENSVCYLPGWAERLVDFVGLVEVYEGVDGPPALVVDVALHAARVREDVVGDEARQTPRQHAVRATAAIQRANYKIYRLA